jgi:hypothetical protein
MIPNMLFRLSRSDISGMGVELEAGVEIMVGVETGWVGGIKICGAEEGAGWVACCITNKR